MSIVFLGLAIIGTIVPYIFFFQYFAANGSAGFIEALFVNGAAGGFSADLLITSLAFWIYLFNQKVQYTWVYIAANLTIGLSCALPLYLYFKTRSMEKAEA
ncbi:MAG: DUF2834 domain-containing protein [Pseudomonadota bacterium]